jgi:tetratricopeptide (TPR) repeat protein
VERISHFGPAPNFAKPLGFDYGGTAVTEPSHAMFNRAQQALREGHWADARRELLVLVETLRAEAGEPLADALRSLGEVERKLRNGEQARARYQQAVAILRNCANPLKLAHAVRHLGDIHRWNGHPDLARPCYDEALALYRAYPDADPLDVANAIRSMAVLRQDAGEFTAARELWAAARGIYAELGIDAGVAECDRCQRQIDDSARP